MRAILTRSSQASRREAAQEKDRESAKRDGVQAKKGSSQVKDERLVKTYSFFGLLLEMYKDDCTDCERGCCEEREF